MGAAAQVEAVVAAVPERFKELGYRAREAALDCLLSAHLADHQARVDLHRRATPPGYHSLPGSGFSRPLG